MRTILQNSRKKWITVEDEINYLKLYVQMESLRFKGKFVYSFEVDDRLEIDHLQIPPMFIQPFVENAIWHGLMLKEDHLEKKLKIRVRELGDKLIIQVEDNGIGREKAAQLKENRQKHKDSLGMDITNNRILLMNNLYKDYVQLKITDLKDLEGKASGTLVEILLNLNYDQSSIT